MASYWTFLLLSTGLAAFIGSAESTGAGLIIVLVFLPLLQLLASLLTLIWISIWNTGFPDKSASLRALGKITLFSVLGAFAGGVAMMLGFKMFT